MFSTMATNTVYLHFRIFKPALAENSRASTERQFYHTTITCDDVCNSVPPKYELLKQQQLDRPISTCPHMQ